MKRKVPLSLTISLMVITASATVLAMLLYLIFSGSPLAGKSMWYSKLCEITEKIDEMYYGEIEPSALADGAAAGLVDGLGDAYAGYYDAEETNEAALSNSGEKVGIGITPVPDPQTETMYVYRLDANGPAAAAGVRKGDRITAVGDLLVAEAGYEEAVAACAGEAGTDLTLQILRNGETLSLTCTRAEFEITTVYPRMVGEIGYLQISRFNEKTPEQLTAAVEEMMAAGVRGLIFDLRVCGGGLVDATARALDYLLPEGEIISATYADGHSAVLHTSDSEAINLPMAVLITGNTASSAELFAAAVRDYGKGVLIGSTTYGKGVMQRTFGLSDGSSVKFTIAEFVPPSGVSFNGVGLSPDIPVDLSQEQTAGFYFLTDEEDPHIVAALAYFSALS
ncbi:MAG: S41 family peptidase [Candidatus Howiella sp.]|jgi:carboxyl-terminal processing protease